MDNFTLEIVGEIQKYIIDRTDTLNDNDITNIYTFVANWLLIEVTVKKLENMGKEKEKI